MSNLETYEYRSVYYNLNKTELYPIWYRNTVTTLCRGCENGL